MPANHCGCIDVPAIVANGTEETVAVHSKHIAGELVLALFFCTIQLIDIWMFFVIFCIFCILSQGIFVFRSEGLNTQEGNLLVLTSLQLYVVYRVRIGRLV